MRRRLIPLCTALVVVTAACSSADTDDTPAEVGSSSAPELDLVPADVDVVDFGAPPTVPEGDLAPALVADLDTVFGSLDTEIDTDAIAAVGRSGDARAAWLLTDLLRFVRPGSGASDGLVTAWEELTGRRAAGDGSAWGNTTNHLIAWDTPAPPGYVDWKRQIFELVEPAWAPFFDDDDAAIDWRWVSWGGVLIDDRPLDRTDLPCPEGCIPALNDPALTDASGGDWYPDERIVFGVVVDGEAVAFPKNIMEIHEMVNMTIAGRRIGMPYCTLCGSAQAYLTDDVAADVDLDGAETYELRTSGLLSRSNKVMYEFHSRSVFDTFTGEAVSGPLADAGVVLEQITVQTSTWGDWKAAHPDTRIVAEDGGIGRSYEEDPLRGRDDNGPIFPIGDVDPRLGVQESVVGVITSDGTPVAFPVAAIEVVLASGDDVTLAGVQVRSDGGGFVAQDEATGEPIAAHQSFWFAWSQFHPDTELWLP
ncbi:MAG: DUF3179 domain-containing (seleno)protein [Actinomycetota bacterium]